MRPSACYAAEREELEVVEASIIGVVSSMEVTNPSILRAVPARDVLRNFGRVLRGKAPEAYRRSKQVDYIDEFWSHSWQLRPTWKVWLLLMLKNGRAACLMGTAFACVASWLSYMDYLPAWYKQPSIRAPGFSGEQPGQHVCNTRFAVASPCIRSRLFCECYC